MSNQIYSLLSKYTVQPSIKISIVHASLGAWCSDPTFYIGRHYVFATCLNEPLPSQHAKLSSYYRHYLFLYFVIQLYYIPKRRFVNYCLREFEEHQSTARSYATLLKMRKELGGYINQWCTKQIAATLINFKERDPMLMQETENCRGQKPLWPKVKSVGK